MEHIYAALTLLALGRRLTEEAIASVVRAAGGTPSPAKVDALLHLCRLLGEREAGPAGGGPPRPTATAADSGAPPGHAGPGAPPGWAEGGPWPGRGAAADGAGDGAPPAAADGGEAAPAALYLYGVVPWEGEGEGEERLGFAGCGGAWVHAVRAGGLAALVHPWPAGATLPEGEDALRTWAEGHLAVLEEAGRRFGTVLPVALGRLVGKEGEDPRVTVRRWLVEEADSLRERCRRLAGREEYGLQVLWDPERWAARLEGLSPELRRLKEEMGKAAEGEAYLLRERFGRVLRAELEVRAAEIRQSFLRVVRERTEDFRLEKLREVPAGKVMLLNMAVLLAREGVAALGEALEEVKAGREGLEVHLTGPWPPYSFVA